MKKTLLLTILCVFVLSINITAFAQEPASPPKTAKMAIVPYINSTEETKGYIQEIIDSKYTEQYSNKNFEIVPSTEVEKALKLAGFDVSNKELPEKDVLASVAKATNADYVIAMEVSQLITTRHMSFFQAKVVTKAKLRYKFYNAEQNKLTSFQVTGESENKTVFGDVGYKDPITKALNQAMDSANEKIMSNL